MSDKYNQEEPSTLQKIQNQTGCLFLVIGVAMLAFVLTDLLSSGSSIFGSNENNIGSIGDENVSYEEFNNTYESLKFQVLQNNPGFVFDENISEQYRQEAWRVIVENKTVKPQYNAVGIQVSAAELEDLTIGDNTHPQIAQSFRNPETNQFDKNRLVRFLKEDINNDANARQSWVSFQNQFTDNLIATKYSQMVSSSFYMTDLEARTISKEDQQTRNATLVAVPYSQNLDSSITVSDNEILAYAKKYKSQYEQDASRNIEYVRLNVVPSATDSSDMMGWAKDAADKFAKATDDSAFVSLMNSESPFDPTYRPKGTFAPEIEEELFAAEVGSVVGPYEKAGVYSVFKVTGIDSDTSGKTIQVAVVDQNIFASTKTDNKYYGIAGQVITRLNGEKTFEEVVEELGLPKGVASNISEKNRRISGIPKADKIARWLFDPATEEGDVSDIIDLNGSYVVARVTKINEEGLPDADDLRSEIETKVRNQKIAKSLTPELEDAMSSASSATELATAMSTTPAAVPAAKFSGSSLPFVGLDNMVSGAIFGTPVGGNSNVIDGENALVVIYVNNENNYTPADISTMKNLFSSKFNTNIEEQMSDALVKSANVVDKRYKFFD